MTATQIILAALEKFESAPSALCLVRSVLSNEEISSECMSNIYERTEGSCDTEVQRLVESASAEELVRLQSVLLDIALEKIRDHEEDV